MLLALLVPRAAAAHGSLAVGDFYGGLLHPVFHPEALLPALAVALHAAQREGEALWRVPASYLGGIAVGAGAVLLAGAGAPPAWALPAAMAALGGLVAARPPLPEVAALGLALAVGGLHGLLALGAERESIARPALYLVGVLAGVVLIAAHVESLVLRFRAFWMQVAVRVVGSWVAAVGLLIAVLRVTELSRTG